MPYPLLINIHFLLSNTPSPRTAGLLHSLFSVSQDLRLPAIVDSASPRHHQHQHQQQKSGMDISCIDVAVVRCYEWVNHDYPLLQRTLAIRDFRARLVQLATQLQTHTQLIAVHVEASRHSSPQLSRPLPRMDRHSVDDKENKGNQDNKENHPNRTTVRSSQSNDTPQSNLPVKSTLISAMTMTTVAPHLDERLRGELIDVLTRLAVQP